MTVNPVGYSYFSEFLINAFSTSKIAEVQETYTKSSSSSSIESPMHFAEEKLDFLSKCRHQHFEEKSQLLQSSADYVNLVSLLTKAHTSGSKKIDLSAEKKLIDRVRSVSGQILLDKNYTWDSPEAMKAQMESLREKVSENNLKTIETTMKISQGKKDMSETTEIVSKIRREHSELLEKIASRMCK